MSVSNRTLADLASEFINALPPEDARVCHPEINRFIRWYGNDRPVSMMSAPEIGAYTEEIENSKTDYNQRLKPVRDFLAYIKKQGHTEINLATHVRIKKASSKNRGLTIESRVVHLTEVGYTKLQDELNELVRMRPKIALELRTAREDKDFKENAPLDAARDHQGHVESRIRDIEATLRAAVIIKEEHLDSERISIGSTVVVHDLSFDEEVRYQLVSPSEVDIKVGKISTASPMGKALLDRMEGEAIDVSAPAGIIKYKIVKVE